MSSETITLRYDGPALEGHQMDVAHLAPALHALGDLCKIANRTFNEDRANVRVFVNVDREQNSFLFDIQIATSLLEYTLNLLDDDRVQDAKSIAEWLGLVGVPPVGYGLYRLVKWLKGRQPEFHTVQDQDGQDMVQVTVHGDNNSIHIAPQVQKMYEDREVRKSVKRVIEPLEEKGYDTLEFIEDGKVTESFNKEDASGILRMSDSPSSIETEYGSHEIEAWIKVHAPVGDENARTWRFQYAGGTPHIDISETSIAPDAVRRGTVSFGDYYYVRLEITQVETEGGNLGNRYKIKQVLDFKPGNKSTQEMIEE